MNDVELFGRNACQVTLSAQPGGDCELVASCQLVDRVTGLPKTFRRSIDLTPVLDRVVGWLHQQHALAHGQVVAGGLAEDIGNLLGGVINKVRAESQSKAVKDLFGDVAPLLAATNPATAVSWELLTRSNQLAADVKKGKPGARAQLDTITRKALAGDPQAKQVLTTIQVVSQVQDTKSTPDSFYSRGVAVGHDPYEFVGAASANAFVHVVPNPYANTPHAKPPAANPNPQDNFTPKYAGQQPIGYSKYGSPVYDNLVRATGVRNQLPGVNVYQSPNGTGYVDDYGRKVNARGEVLGPDGYALRVQPPPPAGGLGTGLRQDSHDVQPSQFPVFPGTTPGALPGTLPGTVPPLPGQLGYPYPGYPTPYQGYPAGGVPGYTPPTSYGGTPLPPMPGPVDPMQGLGYGYPDPYAAYLQPGFNPLDPYGLLQPTTQNNQMVWDPVTQSFYSNQVNQAYDPNTDTFSPTMNYNPYSSYLDPAIAGWVYSRPFRSTGQYLSELDKSPGVGTALRELYGRGVGHPATTRDAVVQRALPAGVRALYNNPAVRALLGT